MDSYKKSQEAKSSVHIDFLLQNFGESYMGQIGTDIGMP